MRFCHLLLVGILIIVNACTLVTPSPIANSSVSSSLNPPHTPSTSVNSVDIQNSGIVQINRAQTPTIPTPLTEVEGERWNDIPFPPLEFTVADEQEELLVYTTLAALNEIEAFYLQHMSSEEWLLFERLSSSENRFGGEVRYLMFWRSMSLTSLRQPSEVACILIGSDDAASVTVTISRECVISGMLADKLRTKPWSSPDSVRWSVWESDEISLRHPVGWERDTRFFAQPYCQPGSGMNCVAGLRYEDRYLRMQVSVLARPRPNEGALIDLALKSQQDAAATYPQVERILMQQIHLDDNSEAIQTINIFVNEGIPGIIVSLDLVDGQNHYVLHGSAAGDPTRMLEAASILMTIARSIDLNFQ